MQCRRYGGAQTAKSNDRIDVSRELTVLTDKDGEGRVRRDARARDTSDCLSSFASTRAMQSSLRCESDIVEYRDAQ